MVDTIDIFCTFKNLSDYNLCYRIIDTLSRQMSGQALHRDKGKSSYKSSYITTAFAQIGILKIALYRGQYKRYCYMLLQPARVLVPGSHITLAKYRDFENICQKMNDLINIVNQESGHILLPPLESWHVMRIDYAVDIETPYVAEYLRLFKSGTIPKGFLMPEPYESSLYMKSRNGNINFYDKVTQVKERLHLSEEAIAKELGHVPPGILRLEFQCHLLYVFYMKERHGLKDTTLMHLYDPVIAEKELRSRIKAIVGVKDFYSYEDCIERICRLYKNRTLLKCEQLLLRLLNITSEMSLTEIKKPMTKKEKKGFAQILHKIRKAEVNPIPLDVAYETRTDHCPVKYLPNPYGLVHCQ